MQNQKVHLLGKNVYYQLFESRYDPYRNSASLSFVDKDQFQIRKINKKPSKKTYRHNLSLYFIDLFF